MKYYSKGENMKNIGLFLATTLTSLSCVALTCTYTAEQEMVRSAENMMEIRQLPNSVDVNQDYDCGGNLMQLAVLRGNPPVFEYVHQLNGDLNRMVSLKGYEIDGAPDKIPFVLFAAKYSPTSSIIDYIIERGADVRVKDSNGHDIFWYFDQNPVLRKSYLTKKGLKGLRPLSEIVAEERKMFQ